MVSLITNIIGYSAAVVGTTIMLPQLIKSIKTKSAGDISLLMLLIFLLNCVLWVAYGTLIKSFPVIISNGIVFVIVFSELLIKLKYEKNFKSLSKNNLIHILLL